tara:strand:+ start:3244 stop:3516 length:273 start_codon:yes stop_codon:yes gene_type:complete
MAKDKKAPTGAGVLPAKKYIQKDFTRMRTKIRTRFDSARYRNKITQHMVDVEAGLALTTMNKILRGDVTRNTFMMTRADDILDAIKRLSL